jgi:hypothetical protein
VQRYGGTVDKFTGDGIMAVFGAPVALEDHAIRACLAALGIQEETGRLAAEVKDRDGIDLRLRVGLNSGQVIAGEIGSGPFGYTAVGEQVGMAQRMESVAPPGGVMLSASTARLVGGAATLSEPELVQIRGADAPVPARRLVGIAEAHRSASRAESNLVGRRWEMSAVEGLLDRAIEGHGAVVGVVGSPGVGKSRLVREVAALARRRGVEVFTVFCESHTNQVHFHAVARLLRAIFGVKGLDGPIARDRVRAGVPDADPEDLLLFHDLLGIADPEVALPKIDPDARRRRLGDPTLTVGLSFPVILAKVENAEFCDTLCWSQRVIDLADGDPTKGNFLFGSSLAAAFLSRGAARYCLGRPGWRVDVRQTVAIGRRADPLSYAMVVTYVYFSGIPYGSVRPDDSAMGEIEDALAIAERSGDNGALALTRMALGLALVHRPTDAERDHGQELLAEVRDVFVRRGIRLCDVPLVNVYLARERARRGDRDDAIPRMRAAVDHLFRDGKLLGLGIATTGVLVETLLDRRADGDVAEAEAAIERLAAAPADEGLVIRDIWLLRLRALLARAHGDTAAYTQLRDRYRDIAKTLGFEGHIVWAEAMP